MLTPEFGKDVYLDQGREGSKRKIMLLELSVRGHYAAYIKHLVKYWSKQKLPGQLDVVVSPEFMQQHSDVVDIASDCEQKNINFVAINEDEKAALKSRNSSFNRVLRTFQEWQLLHKYATLLEVDQCLIMYFDTFQFPLALGARLPCPFAGIYFRPTFHYCNFANYVPSWKAYLQQWREKFILSRILHHPQMQVLFCLDPFAVKHIDEVHSKAKVVYLPDPVEMYHDPENHSEKLKESLGIDPDRKVFLLFGFLTDSRKGIHQLLEAVSILPSTLCQKLCLMFVGEVDPIDRVSLESKIAVICQYQPIQIIKRYEFIPEQNVHAYFQLTDVVLAPYQRHVGMSGILLLAAAAQKPVLSSNYGLMGQIVKHHSLGLTVDSTVPGEIAQGLTRFLLESSTGFCDRNKMKAFAEQNSAEQFASVIFQHVYV